MNRAYNPIVVLFVLSLGAALCACGQNRVYGDGESGTISQPNETSSDSETSDSPGGGAEDANEESSDTEANCDAAEDAAQNGDSPDCEEGSPDSNNDIPEEEPQDEGPRHMCFSVGPITCSQGVTANTVYSSGTDIENYACTPAPATGPELAYTFMPATTQEVTATLNPLTGVNALDLFVLKDEGQGCDASTCFNHGGQSVTWTAAAGEVYYLVVDGLAGASGLFELALQCSSLPSTEDTPAGGDDTSTGSQPNPETNSEGGESNPDNGNPDDNNTNSGGGVDSGEDSNPDGPDSSDATLPPDGCVAQAPIDCGAAVSGNTDSLGAENITQYSCSTWWESGPEVAYSFVSTADQEVVAVLDIVGSTDLDVFILEENGQGCHGDHCVGYGNNDATLSAVAGQTYYVVVDGFSNASGSYTLDLQCDGTPASGGGSSGGDAEPEPEPEPTPELDGETCWPVDSIGCGQTRSNNTQDHLPSNITLYATSTWWMSGPEVSYSFTASQSGTVTATLFPTTYVHNLDLFLLQETGNGCNAEDCLERNGNEITWDADAGTTYYLVVDGFSQAQGPFDLTLSCDP